MKSLATKCMELRDWTLVGPERTAKAREEHCSGGLKETIIIPTTNQNKISSRHRRRMDHAFSSCEVTFFTVKLLTLVRGLERTSRCGQGA